MKLNSATILRAIWMRHANDVRQIRNQRISMRGTCHLLGVDASALAKWMTEDASIKKRIPIRHLPELREILMMSQKEYDQLMEARLGELEEGDEHDETIIACKWIIDTLASESNAGPLSNDEVTVLAAFRKAQEKHPRGLYFDADEAGLLEGVMNQILSRAQRYHEQEDVANYVDGNDSGSKARQDAFQETLKALTPLMAKKRKEHFLVERDRILRQLRSRKTKENSVGKDAYKQNLPR